MITIEEIANVYILVIAKLIVGVNGSLAPSGHSLHSISGILCSLKEVVVAISLSLFQRKNTIFLLLGYL